MQSTCPVADDSCVSSRIRPSVALLNAWLIPLFLVLSDPVLLLPLGIAATAIFTLRWLWAAGRTLREPHDGEPLYVLRTLLPGVFAVGLSGLGLYLAHGHEVGEPLYYAGLALFALELAFLAMSGDDLHAGLDAGRGE